MNKIEKALKKIKCNDDCTWYVPNRKYFDSFEEFVEFERQRLLEFDKPEIRNKKYKNHYDGYAGIKQDKLF